MNGLCLLGAFRLSGSVIVARSRALPCPGSASALYRFSRRTGENQLTERENTP